MKNRLLLNFFVFCLLLSSVAKLQAITLDLMIRKNGELLMKPTIVADFGEPATLAVGNDQQEGVSLEVLTTKDHEEESLVHIQFELSGIKKLAKQELFQSTFMAKIGEEANLSVGSGEHEYVISVTPRFSDEEAPPV